jgi:drug/metabolite transporter (DMT)-like permease
MTASQGAPARLSIILAFLDIYFCWSATYPVMSIGVHLLPATVFAAVRMLLAGALLLAFCAFRGKRIFLSRAFMGRLMLLGVLLLFGGNIGLVWSVEYLPSGLAALIVAVVPLYVAIIEILSPGGDRLRKQGYFGLALGFCAMVALLWPSLRNGFSGHPMQILAIAAILVGAFSWAYGSVLSRRMDLPIDPLVAAGWEMFAAGVANVFFATLFWRWPHAVWNWRSISCIAYMILLGSLLGYTSYIWLISHVPVSKVSTYAYVNPMLAVALGAFFLHETLEPSEYIGMVAITASVALVTTSQHSTSKPAVEVESQV